MKICKRNNSNAISEDTPSYFKSNHYVEIRKKSSHSIGKKIFPMPAVKNVLTPEPDRISSNLHIRSPVDQDLDSIKFSAQSDIMCGYKNKLRFLSNHYKSFFEKIETFGFRRVSTEITSLHEKPKIVRQHKVRVASKQKQRSFEVLKGHHTPLARPSEFKYLKELNEGHSKKKNHSKADNKVSPTKELDDFDIKLREQSFGKGKNVYELYNIKPKGSNVSNY
ncbi:hypothetical protein SteCoe_16875 [Stentor coeruleus]|uniref:Uncharacterized protein n=1 Tax=Stentor coeruleus TaxID=5963 RepID=A0A1R2C038_9CILI|nr:hypothetical protein SteCoe_16875 [Stentor coeruleus]